MRCRWTLGDLPVVALKLITRIILSLVLGWFLLIIPMGIAAMFGMHSWGFMHSLAAILSLPFTVAVAFWLLGSVPFLRLATRDEPSSSQPPVA